MIQEGEENYNMTQWTLFLICSASETDYMTFVDIENVDCTLYSNSLYYGNWKKK